MQGSVVKGTLEEPMIFFVVVLCVTLFPHVFNLVVKVTSQVRGKESLGFRSWYLCFVIAFMNTEKPLVTAKAFPFSSYNNIALQLQFSGHKLRVR